VRKENEERRADLFKEQLALEHLGRDEEAELIREKQKLDTLAKKRGEKSKKT
jgi:hypothetical protein